MSYTIYSFVLLNNFSNIITIKNGTNKTYFVLNILVKFQLWINSALNSNP